MNDAAERIRETMRKYAQSLIPSEYIRMQEELYSIIRSCAPAVEGEVVEALKDCKTRFKFIASLSEPDSAVGSAALTGFNKLQALAHAKPCRCGKIDDIFKEEIAKVRTMVNKYSKNNKVGDDILQNTWQLVLNELGLVKLRIAALGEKGVNNG